MNNYHYVRRTLHLLDPHAYNMEIAYFVLLKNCPFAIKPLNTTYPFIMPTVNKVIVWDLILMAIMAHNMEHLFFSTINLIIEIIKIVLSRK